MSNLSYMVIGVQRNMEHQLFPKTNKPLSRKDAQRLCSAIMATTHPENTGLEILTAHVIEIVDTHHFTEQ